MSVARLVRGLTRIREPRIALVVVLIAITLAIGIVVRWHFASFLDPFEDGYQHWWIAANLAETGEYWDRHSMMTQGNWLPFYHVVAAGLLKLTYVHSIELLKWGNILLSCLTSVLIFLTARKEGAPVAVAAVAFFALNFVDIVTSGWSTAESLATFLVVLGYAALFRFRLGANGHLWLAGIAFSLAVLTRYEAWLIVALLFLFVLAKKETSEAKRRSLLALTPAAAVMAAYVAYSSQWGFLPAIIVNQTSTDIRFQVAAGTQRSAAEILLGWWTAYFGFFPLTLVLGAAYAVRAAADEFASWILFALWGFIVVYSLLRFGNPSYRYVMIASPFLSIMAAVALRRGVQHLFRGPLRKFQSRERAQSLTFAVIAVVVVVTTIPSIGAYWNPGFPPSRYMEPLKRAGEFLSATPLPPGEILVCESPIAAYYSGYPAARILGSRWLPSNRSEALEFLKAEAAYVVYVGVPYYQLRLLFPELQDGRSTADFNLLFDAGGQEAGTHAVYVFGVVP